MKKPKNTGNGAALQKTYSSEELAKIREKFCKLTGTTTESGAQRITSQMAAMMVWGRKNTDEQKAVAALDLIMELAPANATEALLAVQMLGVHEAALLFLQRATAEAQTFEGCDANVLRAARLMRLFSEQVELVAKLKGKTSQQKVTVEHVHIHQGGQAIVGAVTTTKNDQVGGGK
jgi:hypothetical protein